MAEAIGRDLGIDDVRAELLPTDKVAALEELQADKRIVAMVGAGHTVYDRLRHWRTNRPQNKPSCWSIKLLKKSRRWGLRHKCAAAARNEALALIHLITKSTSGLWSAVMLGSTVFVASWCAGRRRSLLHGVPSPDLRTPRLPSGGCIWIGSKLKTVKPEESRSQRL